MSQQDAITSANKFVALVRTKYPVEKAYIFGSYAKNQADEASDIDVCVISSAFGSNYLDDEMQLIELATKIDNRLSPVAFNQKDFQDRWSQLAHEITKYGVLL